MLDSVSELAAVCLKTSDSKTTVRMGCINFNYRQALFAEVINQ